MASSDHLIIYASAYIEQNKPVDDVLTDIHVVAKERNAKLDITGVLMFHNGEFLQAIEGSKEALETLMSMIERDSRHHDIHRLIDEPIRHRFFKQWNMDTFNLDEKETIDVAELEKITQVYKRTLADADTGILIKFYKAMLESGIYR